MQQNQAQERFGSIDLPTPPERATLAGAFLPVGGEESFDNVPVTGNEFVAHERYDKLD
jgi:hypothetical protein